MIRNLSLTPSLKTYAVILLGFYAAVFAIGLSAYYVLALCLLPVILSLREKAYLAKSQVMKMTWRTDQLIIFLIIIVPFFFMALRQRLAFAEEFIYPNDNRPLSCVIDQVQAAMAFNLLTPVILIYLISFHRSMPVAKNVLILTMLLWCLFVTVGLNAVFGSQHDYKDTVFGGLIYFWPSTDAASIGEIACGSAASIRFKFI